MSVSIPRDCFVWFGDDCVANGGDIIPGTSLDVTQVNLALDLRGDFAGRTLELTLTNGARVFTSRSNPINLNGFYVGFLSFEFEKFHVNAGESYNIQLCIDDDTGISFGMIADWQDENGNYANAHTKTQDVPGPRVELYGVTSGLHAC